MGANKTIPHRDKRPWACFVVFLAPCSPLSRWAGKITLAAAAGFELISAADRAGEQVLREQSEAKGNKRDERPNET